MMEKATTSSGKRERRPLPGDEGLRKAPMGSAQVLLRVYLWTEDGGHAPELAIGMVGDLFSASPCEIRKGSSSPIAASFLETLQAVNAARRLRRLVEGFSQTSKAGRLGGCFILSIMEADDLEVGTYLKHLVSVVARKGSGQLLVVGGLYESAKLIPGLRFEGLSEEWLRTGNSAFYQPVMELMPPVQMEGYVEEPAECWAPAVERKQQVAISDEIAALPLIAEVPPIQPIDEILPALVAEPVVPIGQEIAGSSRLQRAPGHRFPLRWLVPGCAAILILAAIAIRVSGLRRSEHSTRQSHPPALPASTPPAVAPAPVAIMPGPAPPAATAGPVEVAEPGRPNPQDLRDAAKAKRKRSDPIQDRAMEAGDAGVDVKKAGADRTGIMFSADEINRTISLADRQSGDGKFDAAISTYRIVLKHDPSNARAKEGLARAIRNRSRQ